MHSNPIVSRTEWLQARTRLLAEEKEFTKMRDALSARRRELPWVRLEKPYVFDTPEGERSLADLFGPHSQLVVYHFMFAPDWEVGCKSCSFWADNFEGVQPHLAARDVSFTAISRAPLNKLQAFAARLGWTFPWVSSQGCDFNIDFHVTLEGDAPSYNYAPTQARGELPGVSVFYKDPMGAVFHTYSCYARGLDMLNGAYHYLDLVPKGRDEADQKPHAMAWLKLRDEYPR
ncbi:MAG: DUF899 domain-containing protein [Myxococcales bacterium]|nr:DUF899 domain-containing protein [Myxococcales bacterium]